MGECSWDNNQIHQRPGSRYRRKAVTGRSDGRRQRLGHNQYTAMTTKHGEWGSAAGPVFAKNSNSLHTTPAGSKRDPFLDSAKISISDDFWGGDRPGFLTQLHENAWKYGEAGNSGHKSPSTLNSCLVSSHQSSMIGGRLLLRLCEEIYTHSMVLAQQLPSAAHEGYNNCHSYQTVVPNKPTTLLHHVSHVRGYLWFRQKPENRDLGGISVLEIKPWGPFTWGRVPEEYARRQASVLLEKCHHTNS